MHAMPAHVAPTILVMAASPPEEALVVTPTPSGSTRVAAEVGTSAPLPQIDILGAILTPTAQVPPPLVRPSSADAAGSDAPPTAFDRKLQ